MPLLIEANGMSDLRDGYIQYLEERAAHYRNQGENAKGRNKTELLSFAHAYTMMAQELEKAVIRRKPKVVA